MTRSVIAARSRGLLGAVLLAHLLGACGSLAAAPGTTRGRVTETLSLRVDLAASRVGLTAHERAGDGRSQRTELRARDGRLALRADGGDTLVIEALDLALKDLKIEREALPPDGLHLTDLALHLPESAAAAATWSLDDGAATAVVTADLELHWALLGPDDDFVPLAPQRITVELGVALFTDRAGAVTARLTATRAGAFLTPAGVYELGDLALDLVAAAN
ncbi:MAG TPA: hypothetical protein VGQ83_24630 [Polyangia bacterium]|jgi:hypothetical protein